jgi:hypothetical protein
MILDDIGIGIGIEIGLKNLEICIDGLEVERDCYFLN